MAIKARFLADWRWAAERLQPHHDVWTETQLVLFAREMRRISERFASDRKTRIKSNCENKK
jgi:hypothetical protein